MERQTIEALRQRVSCAAVLVDAGYAIDVRESTRRALKFRRGAEIIIVTHGGAGWFDRLSDEKGDVFALAGFLEGSPFVAALECVSRLAGTAFVPEVHRPAPTHSSLSVVEQWQRRRQLAPASLAWNYLLFERALPAPLLRLAAGAGIIREGPYGSAWFAHRDDQGSVSGWEERGAQWRGFSKGGAKTLFRFGRRSASRLCITEAAIDALSLAAIEDIRSDTLYASTGGGWSPSTMKAIKAMAARALLVAATDADPQGEVYADRLRAMAGELGSDFVRLRPRSRDWNEDLKQKGGEDGEVAHARSTGSRVELRPPDRDP